MSVFHYIGRGFGAKQITSFVPEMSPFTHVFRDELAPCSHVCVDITGYNTVTKTGRRYVTITCVLNIQVVLKWG